MDRASLQRERVAFAVALGPEANAADGLEVRGFERSDQGRVGPGRAALAVVAPGMPGALSVLAAFRPHWRIRIEHGAQAVLVEASRPAAPECVRQRTLEVREQQAAVREGDGLATQR